MRPSILRMKMVNETNASINIRYVTPKFDRIIVYNAKIEDDRIVNGALRTCATHTAETMAQNSDAKPWKKNMLARCSGREERQEDASAAAR